VFEITKGTRASNGTLGRRRNSPPSTPRSGSRSPGLLLRDIKNDEAGFDLGARRVLALRHGIVPAVVVLRRFSYDNAKELTSLSIDLHQREPCITMIVLQIPRCPPSPACAAITNLRSISLSLSGIHTALPWELRWPIFTEFANLVPELSPFAESSDWPKFSASHNRRCSSVEAAQPRPVQSSEKLEYLAGA
jgi:hypothetical protein